MGKRGSCKPALGIKVLSVSQMMNQATWPLRHQVVIWCNMRVKDRRFASAYSALNASAGASLAAVTAGA